MNDERKLWTGDKAKLGELAIKAKGNSIIEASLKSIEAINNEKDKIKQEIDKLERDTGKTSDKTVKNKLRIRRVEDEIEYLKNNVLPRHKTFNQSFQITVWDDNGNTQAVNFTQWANDWFSKNEKKDNRVTLADLNIETVTSEVKAALAAIAYQFGKIDAAKFNTEIARPEYDTYLGATNSHTRQEIAALMTVLLPQLEAVHNVSKERGRYEFGHEHAWKWNKDENYTSSDNVPKPSRGQFCNELFRFEDFFRLMSLLARVNKNTDFLTKVSGNGIIKTDYSLRKVGSKYDAIKDQVPQAKDYNVDFYLVSNDSVYKHSNTNGLKDWFNLYEKISANIEGADLKEWCTNPMEILAYNMLGFDENGTPNPGNTNPDSLHTYTMKRTYDDGRKSHVIWCFADVPQMISDLEVEKEKLEVENEQGRGEVGNTQKLIAEKRAKMQEQEDKLIAESKKISDEIPNLLTKKREKLTPLKTQLNDNNFDWVNETNILTALGAKQILADIRFLENEGNQYASFKEKEERQLWQTIEEKQRVNASQYDKAVKKWFDAKGSTPKERVNATADESGQDSNKIGLDIIKEYYNKDEAVMQAIQERIEKESPIKTPEVKLTKENLKDVFGIDIADVTDQMVTDWENFSATFKDKDKIKELLKEVIGEADAAKKTNFITHLKKPTITGKSDEEIWKEFAKKTPEEIVKIIVDYLLETDTDLKTLTITKMKDYKEDNKKLDKKYFDATGEPTDEGIKTFLFEEKGYKKHALEGSETPGEDNEPKNWYNPTHYPLQWGAGATLVVIGLIAVFWKKISAWWSEPSDEEGKSGEGEEEND